MLLKPIVPVLDYVINYDYIAKELCENKAKPKLNCNGKCHLMKELAKASEDEAPQSDKKTSPQQTEILFYEALGGFIFSHPVFISADKNESAYSNLYSNLTAVSFFHPPAFIS
jgi:hypothetical protein